MKNDYKLSGTVLPLRRNNVDTDQIIPARFCCKATKSGHENSLFANWREDPNFILNNISFKGSSILVAGIDFGIGSSREYAVWALKDYGFKVIISSRFGDIFYRNSIINSLLPIKLSEPNIFEIWEIIEENPDSVVMIDLTLKSVTLNYRLYHFEMEDHLIERFKLGINDIELTKKYLKEVELFEKNMSANISKVI